MLTRCKKVPDRVRNSI